MNNSEKLLFTKIMFKEINLGSSKINLPYGRLQYLAPNRYRDWHHLYFPIRCGGVQCEEKSLFDCLVKLCRLVLKHNKEQSLPWIKSDEIINRQIIEGFKKFKFYRKENKNGNR